ncbi:MAG: NYN domain-containing protein [Gaiellaceae bacterium]
MLVLVDARNVLRSRWPNLPEQELVERCRAWAHAQARAVVVVFDGRAPGGLVGERQENELLRVVGSGHESADDWLTRAAVRAAEDGSPYWLVTSDRELRRRAGGSAERMIGGGGFVRTLTDAG